MLPEKDITNINEINTEGEPDETGLPAVPGELGANKRGKPDYYEAWHEPVRNGNDSEANIHSPHYHRAAERYENRAFTVSQNKKEKKACNAGVLKVLRVICLVLVCGIVGSLCGNVAADRKIARMTEAISPALNESGQAVADDAASGSDGTVTEKAEVQKPASQVVSDPGKQREDASEGTSVFVQTAEPGDSAAEATLLSPEAIYSLACAQSVGIQVTSSGYNIFGQLVTGKPISGSGFIVSEDGYVVTNYHVVESAVSSSNNGITVQMYDGTAYEAELTGFDSEADIAVLKIEAENLQKVTIGSMSNCQVGNRVYAVGNPLGELTYTMTDGIICALDRVISTDTSSSINVFQINAAVNSGNSGGPVYNSRGEVIGIVDAKYSATGVEGIGFAIPLDDAVELINELIENGYVTGKPYLGVSVRTVSGTVAAYYHMTEGAYIDYVEQGSCADTAGLQAGDILTQIGDISISCADDVRTAKASYSAGDTVTVVFDRNGEAFTAMLTFDEDQSTVQAYQQNNRSRQGNLG